MKTCVSTAQPKNEDIIKTSEVLMNLSRLCYHFFSLRSNIALNYVSHSLVCLCSAANCIRKPKCYLVQFCIVL